MKKFIITLVAVFTVFAATAQTVESSKVFENTQVSVMGGVITTNHMQGESFFGGGAENIFNGLRPVVGIEVAKYVTPVVGFGVQGLTAINTTGTKTAFDQVNVVGNVKFNLSNWIGNYKGEPRLVEVVAAPGLGWGHDNGNIVHDRNYLTFNAGAEVNFNMGKAKAWQINVRPSILWHMHDNVQLNKNNMHGTVMVGLTYKFKSKSKKSHNFVVCPYTVTKAQYDEAVAKYEELASREPEVRVVEKVVEKEVVKVETKNVFPTPFYVTFKIGSSKLTGIEKSKLERFIQTLPKDVKITITGSADTKTGSQKRNQTLAQERAEVVASFIKKFDKEPKIQTEFDVDSEVEMSRAALIVVE